MYRRLLITLFIFIYSIIVLAQKGYVYLHNYQVPIANIDYQNLSCVQSEDGKMFFANTKGVLSFDGESWELISTKATPFSMDIDTLGRIFVGCNNDYGYIKKDEKGIVQYKSLYRIDKDPGRITSVVATPSKIFFYSVSKVFVLDNNLSIVDVFKGSFKGCFKHNNQFYLNVENKGFYVYNKDKAEELTGLSDFNKKNIITYDRYDDNHTILGTSDNEIYLFDGKEINKYDYKSKDYVKGNLLSSCLSLNENDLVIGTLSGGCVILDKKTGEKKNIINIQSGLPDDEVLALYNDNQGGLWICNEYAVSRADPGIPVQNYSSYIGLEGSIITTVKANGNLYVATNEGVFILTRVRDVNEIQHLIKKEHKQTTYTETYRTIKSVTKLIKVKFNTKDPQTGQTIPINKNIPITIEVPVDSVATKVEDIFKNKRIRKTYAMESIPFVYKKIKGVDGKCKQMVVYDKKVMVASNTGLYEVDSIKAVPVLKDRYINFIHQSVLTPQQFYIGLDNGIVLIEKQSGGWAFMSKHPAVDEEIFSITQDKNYLWLGSQNKTIRINLNKDGTFKRKVERFTIDNNFSEQIIARKITPGIVFFTSSNIYTYSESKKKLVVDEVLKDQYINMKSRILFNQPKYTWVELQGFWRNISSFKNIDNDKIRYVELFKNIVDIYYDTGENLWVVENDKLYKINNDAAIDERLKAFDIVINGVIDKGENYQKINNVNISYNNNALSVDFAAPFYLSSASTQYRYRCKGLKEDWTDWSDEPFISYNYLPSGNYNLHIQAKNIFGYYSPDKKMMFTVATPFWKTWWFYTALGILFALLVFLAVRLRIRQLQRAKEILEKKVQEATVEIRNQRDEIQKKNEDITASINYAQRIQEAILPEQQVMVHSLKDFFVLFRPRDIVSGDFYWFMEDDKNIIIIAADCTGHGVPGAFMSMIGNTLLNQIIREKNIKDPGKILEYLDEEIVRSLKQDREETVTKDGMDITICNIYKDKPVLTFAGANNPLYYFQNNESERIRGEKFGIGGKHPKLDKKTFETHTVDVSVPTACYIFSDGYADQNGGPNNQKFMSGHLRKKLHEIHSEPFEKQKEILDNTLDEWMGDKEQRDDIILIGFKVGK